MMGNYFCELGFLMAEQKWKKFRDKNQQPTFNCSKTFKNHESNRGTLGAFRGVEAEELVVKIQNNCGKRKATTSRLF